MPFAEKRREAMRSPRSTWYVDSLDQTVPSGRHRGPAPKTSLQPIQRFACGRREWSRRESRKAFDGVRLSSVCVELVLAEMGYSWPIAQEAQRLGGRTPLLGLAPPRRLMPVERRASP